MYLLFLKQYNISSYSISYHIIPYNTMSYYIILYNTLSYHTILHTCIHTYLHTYTHINTHIHSHIHTYIHIYTYTGSRRIRSFRQFYFNQILPFLQTFFICQFSNDGANDINRTYSPFSPIFPYFVQETQTNWRMKSSRRIVDEIVGETVTMTTKQSGTIRT